MSTVIKFVRTNTRIIAQNQKATITLELPLGHEILTRFPPNKNVLFAKCRAAGGTVEFLQACKPWRE